MENISLEQQKNTVKTLNLKEMEEINGSNAITRAYLATCGATWAMSYGGGYAIGKFAYHITH